MRSTGVCFALLLSACGPVADPASGSGDPDLTSRNGRARKIEWDGFVYVTAGASDDVAQSAVRMQVKSFLGAGRGLEVELQDRDAQHNLDASTWTRERVTIAGTQNQLDRVRYHYSDTAMVSIASDPGAALDVTLLFGDYVARAAELKPECSDDQTTDADSLWYHFTPQQWSCRQAITAEKQRIDSAAPAAPAQISQADADRRFVGIRGKLTALDAPPVKYPEYDRLLGFGSDRTKIVAYVFVGVEHDEADTTDLGLAEYVRFIRTIRAHWPHIGVSYTQPFAMLLDFYRADGTKIDGVTFDDVAHWILDGTGYPAGVDANQLKQQVRDRLAERWIYWTLPLTITRGAETRQMTLEIRSFWGWEDGTVDRRQAATWRYLEAFWNADVFAYAGHSHFGHGPLEPQNYWGGNFPADRYQVMLVNSCLSYNYYDTDFLVMHPGGSRNLDVVTNGLPAYWNGMGQSTASYVIALVEGQKNWSDVLGAMAVPDPLGSATPYDPMRVVNGELDNTFDPANGPITVSENR
jgi:hypothetical protein